MYFKDFAIAVRSRAIGIMEMGELKKNVAKRLGVGERTVRSWWCAHKSHKSLQSKHKSGRVPSIKLGAKITIQNPSERDVTQRKNGEEIEE